MTSVPRRLLVLVGVVLLGYEALGFRSMKYEQYFLYLIGTWVLLGITLNGMLFGQWVQESVYVPGNIGVALALCRGHVSRQTTKVIFFTTAAYFLYRLVDGGEPGGDSPDPRLRQRQRHLRADDHPLRASLRRESRSGRAYPPVSGGRSASS